MLEGILDSVDMMKVMMFVILGCVFVIINKFNARLAQKVINKYTPKTTNYRIGIIGNPVGLEKQAQAIVENALETFLRIGGNVLKTNIILKVPTNKGLFEVVRPLAEKYKIGLVGVQAYKEDNDTRKPEEKLDDMIYVEGWSRAGDESQQFLRNVDQLIYLVGRTENEVCMNEYRDFSKAKLKYDLAIPEYKRPVESANMN